MTRLLAIAAIGSTALAQPATFQGIGHIPSSVLESSAAAVSANGRVVVGSSRASSTRQPVRWTDTTGLEVLEPAPGWGTPSWNWYPTAASADGSSIAGYVLTQDGNRAFRWRSASGMVNLGQLPGGGSATGYGISGDGSIVIGVALPSKPQAFRWTEATGMQTLVTATVSFAYAINGDGTAIAGRYGGQGFRWTTAGGMSLLGPEPDVFPFAISTDGTVIVGRIGGAPFRWVLGTGFAPGPTHLPGATFSSALAVSGDGSVVVGQSGVAFIWDALNGTRPLKDVLQNQYGLDLTGWQLLSANGISQDGRVVVGTGTNPCGQQEGWIARLGPGPACYPDCSADGALNITDFTCFLNRFANGDPYANCDRSCTAPIFNVTDFICYLNRFAVGCS